MKAINGPFAAWITTAMAAATFPACGPERGAHNEDSATSEMAPTPPTPAIPVEAPGGPHQRDVAQAEGAPKAGDSTKVQVTLAPAANVALERLLVQADLEMLRKAVCQTLAAVPLDEQAALLTLGESVLTSREYALVLPDVQVKSLEALAALPQESRVSVAAALRAYVPAHPANIQALLITAAFQAPTARTAEALAALARLAATLESDADSLVLLQTLNRPQRPAPMRALQVKMLLWLLDDDQAATQAPGPDLAGSLANLIVGSANDAHLGDYLAALLSHPTPRLRAVAHGLASFVRSRQPGGPDAQEHLDILMNAPEPEFVGAMEDVGYFFRSPHEPETLQAILSLQGSGQQWRSMLLLLRKYRGDTDSLRYLASIDPSMQIAVLDRALIDLLDHDSQGSLTVARLQTAAGQMQ